MSFDIRHRASRTIAQGALTNSKHPDRFPSIVPSHMKWGKGCFLYDFEENEWIDLISGLGANHFGYGCEKIQSEVIKYSLHGDCHSLPTHHEVDCAEKIQELFPFVEKVKFVNDGSSACTAGCIMARAATGRK